jgi:hypothetical protein
MGERVFHVLRLSLLGWSPVPSGHVTEFPRSTHPVGVVGAIDDVNIPDLLTEGCPSATKDPCLADARNDNSGTRGARSFSA